MKNVTVLTKFDEEAKYTALTTVDDVNDYAESLGHHVENAVTRMLKSKVPIDRWDHMITRDDQGGVIGAAVQTANVRGTNPIYEVGPLYDQKIQSFFQMVAAGTTILVNSNGGYCPFDPDYHTIIEEVEYTAPEKFKYKIKKGTKYINLENDPNLEPNAANYLRKVDPNYSWITNLYNVSEDRLCEILTEFREAGGEVVYVFTTATNVEQMYLYSRCIIDAGIRKVEFKFSVEPIEQDVKEVIKHLEDFNIEVEVL